jgi:hypothetical protein
MKEKVQCDLLAPNESKRQKNVRLGKLKTKKRNKRRRIMSLRKFREFIQDDHRPALKGSKRIALEERAHGSGITDAATVIIGSELSASERMSLTDSFVNDVKKMSEGGGTIIATAVVLE